jgi:hypothetical protein
VGTHDQAEPPEQVDDLLDVLTVDAELGRAGQ